MALPASGEASCPGKARLEKLPSDPIVCVLGPLPRLGHLGWGGGRALFWSHLFRVRERSQVPSPLSLPPNPKLYGWVAFQRWKTRALSNKSSCLTKIESKYRKVQLSSAAERATPSGTQLQGVSSPTMAPSPVPRTHGYQMFCWTDLLNLAEHPSPTSREMLYKHPHDTHWSCPGPLTSHPHIALAPLLLRTSLQKCHCLERHLPEMGIGG